MQLNNFVFPHPVLSNYTDDISGKVDYEQSIIEEKDNYCVSINYEIENEGIVSLMQKEKAINVCEVQCSATLYRRIYYTFKDEIDFTIPRKAVRGRVDLECFVISTDEIKNYKAVNCHSDYGNYNFEIEKGDLLAYYDKFRFDADIRYHKLKAVSSFLEIIPDEVENVEFILENPKIIIKLPKEDFENYAQTHIGKNKDFAPIFHSSIVFSALLYALYNIEDHSERTWAEVIKIRMQEEELKDLSLDEKTEIPVISQKLLGYPVSRLINGLDNIYKNQYV